MLSRIRFTNGCRSPTKRVKISRFFFPVWFLTILALSLVITLVTASIFFIPHPGTNTDYQGPNVKRSTQIYNSKMDHVFNNGCFEPSAYIANSTYVKQNATLLMLTRNSELEYVVKSMRSMEDHFNKWFNYPWTFLNDEEFDESFKNAVRENTKAKVEFGVIPKEQWNFPSDITDSLRFKEGIEIQGDRGIMYGSMESYHKMCRFFSGWFYKHPLVRQYEWYWRVEPDVEFFCDLTYDPFHEMNLNGKKYGFVVMIKEIFETVPNLFRATKQFLKENKIAPKSAWDLFVSNYKKQLRYRSEKKWEANYQNIEKGYGLKMRVKEVLKIEALLKKLKKLENLETDEKLKEEWIYEVIQRASARGRMTSLEGEQMEDEVYSLFHFWSNFEIARVDLWDNPQYQSYYDHLERNEGFFLERWGDAPVHTLGVAMFLDLNEIHYFRDIGYKHSTIHHCPANHPNQILTEEEKKRYWSRFDRVRSYGTGCRCRCPRGEEIEDSSLDYLKNWFEMNSDKYVKPRVVNIDRMENELRRAMHL